MNLRVALATSAALPNLDVDDQHLVGALDQRGIEVRPRVWSDDAFEGKAWPLTVIRSTWDYTERLADFLAFTERVEQDGKLENRAALVRWNADKHYLETLSRERVAIVPTVFVPLHAHLDVKGLCAARGWTSGVVVKPCVSAGAQHTERCQDLVHAQALLDAHAPKRTMMVQPYLRAIEEGERSLVFVDGKLTHAVLKTPALGDFRSQEKHGARIERVEPTSEELRVARDLLDVVGARPLYARVDLVASDDGKPLVMELELIEPSLFFAHAPEAADALAAAIERRITDA
jgi:glutathione synthase/RimK-type ligase-like ATP-grasp enzyme